MSEPDEFSIIDQLFKPLAGFSREARGLIDDVAVIRPIPITTCWSRPTPLWPGCISSSTIRSIWWRAS